jgi:uncharacterized protein
MPREERFFELFVRHAQVTLAGAEALRALLSGGGDVVRCCNEVNSRENEADEITREVLTALRRSFITPLDRGDIKDLITSMDDAIDQMNKTVKVIHLFEFRGFQPSMQEMGELIVRAAKVTLEAVPLLRSIGKQAGRLNALTEEIIRIEGQSDELHDKGRRDRLHDRHGGVRSSRGSGRSIRGRGKRNQRNRHRECVGADPDIRLKVRPANGRSTRLSGARRADRNSAPFRHAQWPA